MGQRLLLGTQYLLGSKQQARDYLDVQARLVASIDIAVIQVKKIYKIYFVKKLKGYELFFLPGK